MPDLDPKALEAAARWWDAAIDSDLATSLDMVHGIVTAYLAAAGSTERERPWALEAALLARDAAWRSAMDENDALMARVRQLTDALDMVLGAIEEFCREADYRVSIDAESELSAALDDARAVLAESPAGEEKP